MIILLYGDDSYRARQKLNQLIIAFRDKHDPSNLNLSKIDGSKITFEELSKHFSSIPFLAKKRMVVVENFLGKKLENPKEIIEYLLHVQDSIIVFFETKDLKKNAFVKSLSRKKKGEIHIYDYPLLRGYGLKQWICDEVKNLSVDIQPVAVEILIQNIGSDLWRMSNELQKLSAYCLGRNMITSKDVQLMISNKLEDNIFKLTDALGDKNTKTSLRIFRDMLELESDKDQYILTMLVRQFRILLETKSFLDEKKNATRDDVAKKFKLHPFVASKSLVQAKKFELDELKKIYAKILEFENKQKTGFIKPALMFDLLAMKLS
ncbi:MAG: DNA polymerase III subunit delta [Patescibacteria group bacterium]|nr:DNA polymerase III subunit delta [Patescibacteria group bacterium]